MEQYPSAIRTALHRQFYSFPAPAFLKAVYGIYEFPEILVYAILRNPVLKYVRANTRNKTNDDTCCDKDDIYVYFIVERLIMIYCGGL